MQAKSKIINKSKERSIEEIYCNPNIPKEKKLEIMGDVFEKYYAIGQAQAIEGDIEKLTELSECCWVSSLVKIDTIFQSNSDEFVLYRCPECQRYWLYHKHEDNWMDNFRFGWDEYQEWYIGIEEEDLPKVYEKKFLEITELHGLVYSDTTHHYPERDWRVFWE